MSMYSDYMPADTVDETAANTGMAGLATVQNQASAIPGFASGPTGSLVVLWVAAMLAYWGMGYLFRGQRS